jgi:hypothetical protein
MKLHQLFEAKQIFYHGSKNEISEFNFSGLAKSKYYSGNVDQEGPGIYLTTSKVDARQYGEYVHEVEVNLVKSRLMPDKRTIPENVVRYLIKSAPSEAYKEWDENPSKALTMATKAIMDAYGPSDYREAMEQIWYDHYGDDSEQYLKKIGLNWDGFTIERGEGITHLIWFKPEKLKIVKVIHEV